MKHQLLGLMLLLGGMCVVTRASPVAQNTGQRSSNEEPTAEENRERQIMERFLGFLEKNPRRGTALDRVYGFHVERGTLEKFVGELS